MKLDRNKKIPFGKHQGRTVDWLLDNDKSYCDWLTKEGLWKKWNLCESAGPKKKGPKSTKVPVQVKGTINYDHNDPPPWDDSDVIKPSDSFTRENGQVLLSIKSEPVADKDNRWIEDVKILLETVYKQKETAPEIKQQIQELLYLSVEN